jgi:hypothetical protein
MGLQHLQREDWHSVGLAQFDQLQQGRAGILRFNLQAGRVSSTASEGSPA